MKLTHIKVANFRGIRAFSHAIHDTLFMTGQNGQGKTSLLHAIQMTLFGRCYDGAGKRIPVPDLVGPHGKAAHITLKTEHMGEAHEWQMNITTTAALNIMQGNAIPFPGPGLKQRESYWAWALPAADVRHAECAANPRAYLLSEDLGVLLSELVSGDVTGTQIRNYAGEHWEWMEELASEYGIDVTNTEKFGALAHTLWTHAKKDLAVTEKAAADLSNIEAPTRPDGTAFAVADLPGVRKLLTERHEQVRTLADELAVARAFVDPQEALATLEAEAEQASIAADRAEQALNVASSDEVHAEQAEKQAGEQITRWRETIRQHTREIERCTEALDALSGSKCPTCERTLTKAVKDTVVIPLRKARMEASEALPKAEQALADAQAAKEKANSNLESARERCTDASQSLGAAIAVVDACKAKLEALEQAPKPLRIADIEACHATAIDRVAKGQAIVTALEQIALRAEKQAEAETLAEEVDHCGWAVTAFEKGDFRNSLLRDTRVQFEDCVNEQLRPFGYELEVRIVGKDVTVHMGRLGAPRVPAPQASKGERLLAEYAVAMAWAPGTPILLDDLDSLASENKALFMGGLKADNVSQRIVAGAWGLRDVNVDGLRGYLAPGDVIYMDQGGKGEK